MLAWSIYAQTLALRAVAALETGVPKRAEQHNIETTGGVLLFRRL